MWLRCHCREEEFEPLLDKVAKDLKEYNGFIMEAEDEKAPYVYLMFKSVEDKEDFFADHKDEQMYQWARLRMIKEPAYIPKEMLENENIHKA